MNEIVFEAPGPGSWRADLSHQDQLYSRWFSDRYCDIYDRAFTEAFADYGMLLTGIRYRVVHGVSYTSPAPPDPSTFGERFARAAEVFATRYWREETRRWDEEQKPAFIAEHSRLQAVEPHRLDDVALRRHLRECAAAFDAAAFRHHRIVMACTLPVGDYVSQVSRWSGATTAEVLATLEGSSPHGIACYEELQRAAAAVAADPKLMAALDVEPPSDALAQLASNDGVAAWLALVGDRTGTGMDVVSPRKREEPAILLAALAQAVRGDRADRSDVVVERTRVLRARVPEAHRADFDSLLAEARHVHRIRDERMPDNDEWATGLMRRALLEAGRRLAKRGRLHEASHVFGLTQDELLSVLEGGEGPSADELEEMERYRASTDVSGAPEFLGPPPPPPPPMDELPPAVRRMTAAMMTYIHAMFDDAPQDDVPAAQVRGLGGGNGAYVGVARVVKSPADFSRVRRGDVLVAQMTMPTHNVLFPLIGAVVTERGGLLSHPAIVAREFGIPAVVGTRDATTKIPDGARITVDGDAGTVVIA